MYASAMDIVSRIWKSFLTAVVLACASVGFARQRGTELVYMKDGVIRWTSNRSEVSLFGANYCLPSALDYRAAGYVGADRKELIRQDMQHFQRMGWDAVRLSFWGDWECCDAMGNLIQNDHLDLMDYLVAEGSKRGMYFLLSPIVTYDARWPEMKEDPALKGFSHMYDRSQLSRNPDAILAQQNYLRQLLRHVNPYTGKALKDEPSILFIEMINEPWHHPQDYQASVDYINALVKAVRDTGCQKLTFHNLSQDFAEAKPLLDSRVDGMTFGWYPSGLVANRQLQGNFLPYTAAYPPMLDPKLASRPKIVYEFDMPDVISGYHYPAMARTFRATGAQWASMFSYDMLATAPYNLGWQTHCLNMVATPKKAVSAIIAARVMKALPRMQPIPAYPDNLRFGPCAVNYDRDLAEFITDTDYLYSNSTERKPTSIAKLDHVVGYGSSPLIHTDSMGIYFADRLSDGHWKLEIYPDAVQVSDPFHEPKVGEVKFRIASRQHPWKIHLPGLGSTFWCEGLDKGNVVREHARSGEVRLGPGIYLLSNKPQKGRHGLIRNKVEFYRPADTKGPASVVIRTPVVADAPTPLAIDFLVVASSPKPSVTLHVASDGSSSEWDLKSADGYHFSLAVPHLFWHPGGIEVKIVVREAGMPSVSKSFRVTVAPAGTPLKLFTAESDIALLDFGRGGPRRSSATKVFKLALSRNRAPEVRASMFVGERVANASVDSTGLLTLKARASRQRGSMTLCLVERDGGGWSTQVKLGTEWQEITIPTETLKPDRWAMLPQGYPVDWSYWSPPGRFSKTFDFRLVERAQFAIAAKDGGDISDTVEIESLTFGH